MGPRFRTGALAAGVLLLVGSAPARAQLAVMPGSVSVAVPQGQAVVETLTIMNGGGETASFCLSFDRPLQRAGNAGVRLASGAPGAPCGQPGEVLLRADTDDVPSWDPFALTMMPDGRLFAAEDRSHRRTFELTPDLQLIRSFEHPFVAQLYPFPTTTGVTYNPDSGTLWWLNVEGAGLATYRALLLEGDLDGNATGRRIELPLPTAPPPYERGRAAGLSYEPAERRYYYVEPHFDMVWAVDTLGNAIEGYPVAQTAYPGAALGLGLDVYGGVEGTAEGVRLEVPVALTSDITYRRLVVTDRRGESLGVETFVPDLSDGTPAWAVYGITRSVLDPNGVLYVAFRNYATAGVVGIRPHPLPPSWLALSAWRGTLAPGESAEVMLTFAAGQREVGDYTAVLQVIEAETGAAVEVPVVLSVTQGTAAEPGPEAEGVRLSVYPNPARGRFFVEVEGPAGGAEADEVAVYDVLGRVVRRAALVDGRAEVSAEGLPAGVYLVRVTAGGEVASQRLTLVQ